jgi:MFS family permease
LLFLTVVNILNYFDRYIVNSVEPLLKAEFNISNEDSAYVISAFVWGYFLFSPIFGYLGDRFDRRILMGAGLLAWSGATLFTGYTGAFLPFFIARVLVGVGEASFGTIVPGYLKGRIKDTVTLNSAFSIFYCAIPVGAALGFFLGGKISAAYSWRHVFQYAAIPGFILALGFLFLAPENRKGANDDSPELKDLSHDRPSFLAGLKAIVSQPIVRLTIVGYILNTFALQGVAAFVVRYGTSLGMQMERVNDYFGLILLVTGFVGTFGGGRLASRFARSSSNQVYSLLKFVSVSTLIGVPFLCAAFVVGSPVLFLVCCFFAELLLFAAVAPLNAVIVEKAPTGLETLTQGVTIFSINLFGSIVGPILIGKAADKLEALGYVGVNGSAPYLSYAMQLSTITMFLSAVTWWFAAGRCRK